MNGMGGWHVVQLITWPACAGKMKWPACAGTVPDTAIIFQEPLHHNKQTMPLTMSSMRSSRVAASTLVFTV